MVRGPVGGGRQDQGQDRTIAHLVCEPSKISKKECELGYILCKYHDRHSLVDLDPIDKDEERPKDYRNEEDFLLEVEVVWEEGEVPNCLMVLRLLEVKGGSGERSFKYDR